MRRAVLGLTVTAIVALPTASAPASDIPPINCGIVSCTYAIERAIDNATAGTEGLQECIANTAAAVRGIINGTPQPAYCTP